MYEKKAMSDSGLLWQPSDPGMPARLRERQAAARLIKASLRAERP